MNAKAIGPAIAVLIASVAFGQTQSAPTVERVFPFTHADTAREFQEIANVIRAIGEIQNTTVDAAAKSLTARGTADQLALAEWIFHALDVPSGGQPAPMLEYRLVSNPNPVVRVFYVTGAPTPQALQETVNAVRSILEVQRVVVYNAARAIVMRGTLDQASGTEWLLNGLDTPAGNQSKFEYHVAEAWGAPVARVFHLTNTATPQGVMEIVNTVRTLTEIMRTVACIAPRAVVLRGSADQVALAEWLIGKLDKPASAQTAVPPTLEYPTPRTTDGIVGLYYVTSAAGPQDLQEVVNQIRSTTSIQRVVACNQPRALAMRGTSDQVAQAERLIQKWDSR